MSAARVEVILLLDKINACIVLKKSSQGASPLPAPRSPPHTMTTGFGSSGRFTLLIGQNAVVVSYTGHLAVPEQVKGPLPWRSTLLNSYHLCSAAKPH